MFVAKSKEKREKRESKEEEKKKKKPCESEPSYANLRKAQMLQFGSVAFVCAISPPISIEHIKISSTVYVADENKLRMSCVHLCS